MKRTLVALLMLCTALTLCPNPVGAAVVIVRTGPGFYAPGYYRGPGGYGMSPSIWHSRYRRVQVGTTVNLFSRPGALRPSAKFPLLS